MLTAATPVAKIADRHAQRPRARLAPHAQPFVRDPRRHLSRRGLGQIARRDPRRFGKGMVRVAAIAAPAIVGTSENLRLFTHTFGAAFLFVTVFLA